MSDDDLLSAVDYGGHPELGPSNDRGAALRQLAARLRDRAGLPAPSASGAAVLDAAAAAARGEVRVVGIPHTFPGGRIDWFYNPTGMAELPLDNEWQWQLNRMPWWTDLAGAYAATGDEQWAQAWVAQLRSWAEQCPPPTSADNRPGSAWRTIEGGIRMAGPWPEAFAVFARSASVRDADVILFARLAVAHARYLSANHRHGNWLTMEMNGLHSVGTLLPELSEAAGWRRQAIDVLHGELTEQFYPDGVQFELSPSYHNVSLRNILAVGQRAAQTGRGAELPADFMSQLERLFDVDLYLMTPDRSLPKFNDCGGADVPALMASAAVLFEHRPDFAYIASNGRDGAPPTATSRRFPDAGYAAMRDGWGRDACAAVFDAGPLGHAHVHQDKLNLVVWSYGREVLFDSGGGNYEQSPFRDYGIDTFSHNTVLVDGQPQRRPREATADDSARQTEDTQWHTTSSYDYARGVYHDGYGDDRVPIARHERRVLFVHATERTGPLWVVVDLLDPNDDGVHAYQARWHLLTAHVVDGDGMSTATADDGQPNLVVVPLDSAGLAARAVSAQTQPELLGWNLRRDRDPAYEPATTVLHERRGRGRQSFATLLIPTRPGRPGAPVSMESDGRLRHAVALAAGAVLDVDATGPAITAVIRAADGSVAAELGG